jgi:hypothetical protein
MTILAVVRAGSAILLAFVLSRLYPRVSELCCLSFIVPIERVYLGLAQLGDNAKIKY